jgi:hypothetical protein
MRRGHGTRRWSADATILSRVELLTGRAMVFVLRLDAAILASVEILAWRTLRLMRGSEATPLDGVEPHVRRTPFALADGDAAIERRNEGFTGRAAELRRCRGREAGRRPNKDGECEKSSSHAPPLRKPAIRR